MSKVTQEKLLAGIIFGDNDNEEYIYLPGGEVGSEAPLCVLERGGSREDLPLEEPVQPVQAKPLRSRCWQKASAKWAYLFFWLISRVTFPVCACPVRTAKASASA